MEKQPKTSPKDFFLHLLAITGLYVSATSLITLYFQYINLAFPDPLETRFYLNVAGPIRYAMASLMVIFPAYMVISWILRKEEFVSPEKKEIKIRKWIVYFTLFIAAVAIISDLVVLIYNFLGGELTARFVLKAVAVFVVAGVIFWHYLWDLRGKATAKILKITAWSVSVIILSSIVYGFFTVGSPLKARLYKFDDQRVGDLQEIQNQIVFFWQQKQVLPENISALRSDITGFAVPKDPETKADYEYKKTGKLAFELCANFNMALKTGMETAPISGYVSENWSHDAGRQCFARTIDPQLNKPLISNTVPVKY